MQLRIKISKKPTVNCIFGIMLFVICERLLESFGAPHSIIFLIDIANVYLFANIIVGHKIQNIFSANMIKIHFCIIVLGILVALFNGVVPQLIVWSLRNLLRFYIFFGACVSYLTGKDVDGFYDVLTRIFYINIIITLVQYMLGFRGDYLGGLFGTAIGANAYNNILQIIVCTYCVCRIFEKKIDVKSAVITLGASLLLSIITETKVFFFELIAIIILNVLVIGIIERKYKVLFRGALIGVFVLAGIIAGAKYIAVLYPSLSNSNFLSIEGLAYILTRESGYTGFGDLNRLTAITSLNKLDCFADVGSRVFGLGLGSAEFSTGSSFLQSAFYKQYDYLHYYWFSHAWMYIECGYVGLIGYILGFFANIPIGIRVIRRLRKDGRDTSAVVTGIVISIMTLLLCIYNQSLRIEGAYLLYFVFAGIYIKKKEVAIDVKTIGKYHCPYIQC